jgi:cell filamentation protein
MGLFAYGHPFLDGNGRTMLLVHAELCFRANMSINWMATDKNAYLEALTQEIAHPHSNPLNYYLQPFIGNKICRDQWSRSISSLPGLNGTNIGSDSSAQYSNPEIAESYRIFENKRKKSYWSKSAAPPPK